MKIDTRLACTTEKDTIWTLYESALRAYIESLWGWDPVWQRDYFSKAYVASATYIVELDTKLCGFIQLDIDDTGVYLRMLVLTPTVRSMGIGASLLQEILRCTHRSGRPLHLRVFRVNSAAKRFYEREGWVVEAADEAFFTMTHPLNEFASMGGSTVALVPENFEVRMEV
ncbi:GNAT family N-acetyltransferase [Massilia pseudoviolaceinigra]|uniref:GNAT family N-acetyltransferase n=1 Tax=Massilia pseudoviolaceinigra TaxID=3057165 RepID=UPI00279688A2|nr:GNAT family N-acetyltransferase [Massilia sp. CCM 9206]MDQ1921107.1 GNAT family N-acetyltransferase [Massilia sp. CCM 9206]